MSSFSNPHYMYLFEMTNGKKLGLRPVAGGRADHSGHALDRGRMAGIVRDKFTKIRQRDLQQYVPELG